MRRSFICFVTGPVQTSTSAWRGVPLSCTPKRSMSKRGVSEATVSMSHALQAPELKCMIQGDLRRAQLTMRVLKESSIARLPPEEHGHADGGGEDDGGGEQRRPGGAARHGGDDERDHVHDREEEREVEELAVV